MQKATLSLQENVCLVNLLTNKKYFVIHFDFTMMTNLKRSQGPVHDNIFVEKAEEKSCQP